MSDDRSYLLDMIRDLAVVKGAITLVSGRQADYYVDLRRVTLHPDAAPVVGRVMLDLIDDWAFTAVGGLTMGADPIAMSVLLTGSERGRRIGAFVVRKETKAHGMQRRIEGPDVSGQRVVVLEDTATTGGSVLTAIEALRRAGAEVAGVAVIVDRDTGAREAIEAVGVPYRTAYELADLG